jgi:AcrR family transcriptional regulator
MTQKSFERRAAIGRALYKSIRKKGFAQTKLQDIAELADMTPSHVRYYFDGTRDILKWYFAETCKQFNQQAEELLATVSADPIAALAESYFPEVSKRRANLGVFLELRALALHDTQLYSQVRQHDRSQIEILAAILTPVCGKPYAVSAAEIAYSLAQGLYMGETLQRFDTLTARAYFQLTLQAAIEKMDSELVPR